MRVSVSRELRRLLAAEGISNFGAMLSRLAIPWLAALVLDATPLQMAALLAADIAAAAIGSLLLGAWVERRGKRAVMLVCDGARALVLAALAWLAWRGSATMTLLALAAAANGALTMAFEVARSAWMAQRLAPDELVHGNAHMAVATSLTETAAFALGGWLFQWLGAALALIVDALSYLTSALCLRKVPEVPPVRAPSDGRDEAGLPAPGRGIGRRLRGPASGRAGREVWRESWRESWRETWRETWRDIAAGLEAVAASPTLRALALLEGLLALAMGLAGTSYTIYVARDLAIPTGQLGLIFALGGLGAIAGARLAAPAALRFGVGRAMAAGLAAAALGAACIVGATGAGAAAIGLLVVHQIVGDGGHTLFSVHDRTLRQTEVGAALLARADAGIRCVGQCATLVGALCGGILGTAFGARGVLALSAAVLAAAAAVAAWKLRDVRKAGGLRVAGDARDAAV